MYPIVNNWMWKFHIGIGCDLLSVPKEWMKWSLNILHSWQYISCGQAFITTVEKYLHRTHTTNNNLLLFTTLTKGKSVFQMCITNNSCHNNVCSTLFTLLFCEHLFLKILAVCIVILNTTTTIKQHSKYYGPLFSVAV